MKHLLNITQLLQLHQECILLWKESKTTPSYEGIYQIAAENHSFNYRLWHTEDKARRDDMGADFVYQAKRDIDALNQQRNNRMETMDEYLFRMLQPAAPNACPVHSESPGMMIDRLSILALKSYHMHLQTQRSDVDDTHRHNCLQKLHTINEQLKQLAACLEQLLQEIQAKTRTFRIYHQFKMYNDPQLNPELSNQTHHRAKTNLHTE